ncbi:MAG: hypothetical protein QM778_10575 [Myxococcales bacterium]
MGRTFFFAALLYGVLWALPRAASAQGLPADVRAAELATQARAQAAIESGELEPAEYARALRDLAVSSAQLSDAAAAQQAFVSLLALDPQFRLEKSLPDHVRSPYLEARGFWSAHAQPLSVEVVREGARLRTRVSDPAGLVARVRMRVRAAGSAEYRETVVPPSAELHFASDASDAQALEYGVTLLDGHGNRLLKVGTDASPRSLPAAAPAPVAAPAAKVATPQVAAANTEPVKTEPQRAAPAEPASSRRHKWRITYLALGASALALGAGALGVGVRANIEREHLADRWNHADCDGSGVTRAEVCADEKARLTNMQRLAVGFYAGGAAALATGVLLLVLAPSRSGSQGERPKVAQRAVRCGGTLGLFGVTCSGAF